MQNEFRVYGRRDEPCDRCGTLIARTQVAGRDDVVLSDVPAGGAGSGGEELVETTFTVEAPELGVAADRPAVDEDLGHRPAAGRHRTPSAGRPDRRRARSPRTASPRESRSVFARTQKPHQRVVYIWILGIHTYNA